MGCYNCLNEWCHAYFVSYRVRWFVCGWLVFVFRLWGVKVGFVKDGSREFRLDILGYGIGVWGIYLFGWLREGLVLE